MRMGVGRVCGIGKRWECSLIRGRIGVAVDIDCRDAYNGNVLINRSARRSKKQVLDAGCRTTSLMWHTACSMTAARPSCTLTSFSILFSLSLSCLSATRSPLSPPTDLSGLSLSTSPSGAAWRRLECGGLSDLSGRSNLTPTRKVLLPILDTVRSNGGATSVLLSSAKCAADDAEARAKVDEAESPQNE